MKKFLFASFCLFTTVTMAQELFPELAGVGTRPKVQETSDEEKVKALPIDELLAEQFPADQEVDDDMEAKFDEPAPEEDENIEQTQPAAETNSTTATDEKAAAPKEETATEEEEEDEDDKKIQIYTAEANATITPNDNFSYCFGKIKFANEMKRKVKKLEVTIAFGVFSNTYIVNDLVKGTEQEVPITLIGKACEHIMDMPQMEVNRCVAEDMEEAKCKEKVQYVPIRGS